MDRRQFLTAMSVALGSSMVLPLQRVLAAGTDIDPVALTGFDPIFSDVERATLSAISEVIIPTTDTPGAIEAGVPRYIEFMLSEWYDADEKCKFKTGLEQLVNHCTCDGGKPFAELDVARQNAIVQSMHDGQQPEMAEGGKLFFEHVKQLTLAGYYTSEIGMTVERVYLPVPGRYDGAYPYEKVGTLFTS